MSQFPTYQNQEQPAEPAEVAEEETNLSRFSNFSMEDALDVMVWVNAFLNAEYIPDSIPWAAEHRPDLMRHARAAESALGIAFGYGRCPGPDMGPGAVREGLQGHIQGLRACI